MFEPGDNIDIMRGLIDRLPAFNFLSFDETGITRVEGTDSSKNFLSPRTRFIEKRKDSAIFWGGKFEVPYYSGVVCFDVMITVDAPTIVEASGLWWVRCYFHAHLSAWIKKTLKLIHDQGLSAVHGQSWA